MPILLFALAIILPGVSVLAQDIVVLFSPCDDTNPVHAVGGSDNQFGIPGLYTLGGCFATDADALNQGYTVCPGIFDAFSSDTDMYFKCQTSLSSTCNDGCPLGTSCFSSLPSGSNSDPYYFCGVGAAGDPTNGFFELCDDAGATDLGAEFVVYYDQISDQCGLCKGVQFLESDGTCSATISSFMPYNSGGYRRRRDALKKRRSGPDAQWEHECPEGQGACQFPGGVDGMHWECVDFNDELAACGGCPGLGGTDCGSLSGVPLGSVTCSNRQCLVSSCEAGFTLHENRCLTDHQLNVALTQQAFAITNATRTISYPPNLQAKPHVAPSRPGKRDVTFVPITNKSQLRTKPWQQVTILTQYSNPI